MKLKFEETPSEVKGVTTYERVKSPADSSVVNFDFLSAKMRVSASLNGKNQSFNTLLRWQKGRQIWMSMSLFGIEGARVLITRDYVQWMDRMNSEYHILPIHKLAQKFSVDLDYTALERLLIGLPALSDSLPVAVKDDGQLIEWSAVNAGGYHTRAVFSKVNNMLIEYIAEDALQKRNLLSRYGDIRKIGDKHFAYDRSMRFVQRTDNIEILSKFSEVSISEQLTFPFDIPERYKRIEY